MLYRISSRFSEKIMKKNAHSNRICWEYLPCLSPFCCLLFPETFLPGIAYSAAWRNINKHYLDSLWKKTLFPSSALRWQISSPTWFEVTYISLGKTSTEIFLTSFVLCKFCGRKSLLWLFAEKLGTHEKQYREQGTVAAMRASFPPLKVWLLRFKVRWVWSWPCLASGLQEASTVRLITPPACGVVPLGPHW